MFHKKCTHSRFWCLYSMMGLWINSDLLKHYTLPLSCWNRKSDLTLIVSIFIRIFICMLQYSPALKDTNLLNISLRSQHRSISELLVLKHSSARTHIPVGFELTYHSQQERMKSKRAHLVAGKEQQYKTTLFKFSATSIVYLMKK